MKRLYRSSKDKVISGVCGGVGNYFGIDPVVVRIIWVCLVIFGGTGVFAYILGWIIIPTGDKEAESSTIDKSVKSGLGFVLLFLGVIFLFQGALFNILPHWMGIWSLAPSFGLIMIGLLLIIMSRDNKQLNNLENTPLSQFTLGEDNSYKGGPLKRVRRSRTERMILGICGGFGKKHSVDPTIIRIGLASLTLILNGFPILIYMILYFIIPLEKTAPKFQTLD